jgi:hypothetical protein
MTVRAYRFLTFSLLLALAGCGSSALNLPDSGAPGDAGTDKAPTVAMTNCPDDSEPIDPTAIIDDMESPSAQTNMPGNRGGSWWAGGDDESKATGAFISPDGDAPAEKIPGGRCGSKNAMHVTGKGFSTWAVLNVSMGYGSVDGGAPNILPYDASFRTGITFWARLGDTTGDQVRLNVTDQYSNDAGGICNPTQGSDPKTYCYDHFGTPLTGLTTEWRRYKIPFLGLSQLGFGLPRPHVDTTAIYSIDFLFPNEIFDLWVDDLYFY